MDFCSREKDYIETRTFPENCAAEDTAGSLKQKLFLR
jgi:hypothetical protein